jgi:hypothetical protein
MKTLKRTAARLFARFGKSSPKSQWLLLDRWRSQSGGRAKHRLCDEKFCAPRCRCFNRGFRVEHERNIDLVGEHLLAKTTG